MVVTLHYGYITVCQKRPLAAGSVILPERPSKTAHNEEMADDGLDGGSISTERKCEVLLYMPFKINIFSRKSANIYVKKNTCQFVHCVKDIYRMTL